MTTCAFCREQSILRDSHVVPKFVFDWLKETSGTGYLRFSETPNKREQDGLKTPMLCDYCEQRFSLWENLTASRIFKPLFHQPGLRHEYQKWFAKFAVSVSWRVLTFFKSDPRYDQCSPNLRESADIALERWKAFLLDSARHPGVFEQHVLPLEGLANTTDPDTPPNMSRYFLRTVDVDLASTETSAFVYTKMCHLLLVGFIKMQHPELWHGTKLRINHGRIGGAVNYHLPGSFLHYLKERARFVAKAYDSISDRQWERITEAYRKDLDRAADSESLRAMNYDVSLFGKLAFRDNTKTKE